MPDPWLPVDVFLSGLAAGGIPIAQDQDQVESLLVGSEEYKQAARERHERTLVAASSSAVGAPSYNVRAVGNFEASISLYGKRQCPSPVIGPTVNRTIGAMFVECILSQSRSEQEVVGSLRIKSGDPPREQSVSLRKGQNAEIPPGSEYSIRMHDDLDSAMFIMASQHTWLTFEEYVDRCSSTLHLAGCSALSSPMQMSRVKEAMIDDFCKQLGANRDAYHFEVTLHGLGILWDGTASSLKTEHCVNYKGDTAFTVAAFATPGGRPLKSGEVLAHFVMENGHNDVLREGRSGVRTDKGLGGHFELSKDMAGAIISRVCQLPKQQKRNEKDLQADARTCSVCGITRPEDMKKCSRCKIVRYCSRACQTADWPKHRKVCKKANSS